MQAVPRAAENENYFKKNTALFIGIIRQNIIFVS
jgi:hypothetical protein